MERIIKFRAWHVKNEKMLPIHGVLAMVEFNPQNEVDKIGVQEYVQTDEEGGADWQSCSYDGKEVVLMQFTGLKDKDGVEIYEGDILSIDPQNGVKFDKESLSYMIGGLFLSQSGEHREIIGNIYQS